jgi:molybdopterin converting factor small subunit
MREKAGTDTIALEVPTGAAVSQALAMLVCQHPILEPYMANTRFSLHMDFVDPETTLAEGDELVLIPPVSGGA